MESNMDQTGFWLAGIIYSGNGRKPRFQPFYNESVVNLEQDDDRATMRLLGDIQFSTFFNCSSDSGIEKVLNNPRYLRDVLLPSVTPVLWAETLSNRIKERIKDGAFDNDQPIKDEMHAITIYLDHSCYHVGKLLCEHLDAIQSQKDTLLESAENSIHEQILAVQQNIKEIKDTANNNQNDLPELLTLIEQSIASSNWLDVFENYSLLGAEVDALNLKKLPDLAKQEQALGEDLSTVIASFEQIEEAQESLRGLVDRNSHYADVSEAYLENLQQTIEKPVQPVESPTSDAPETRQTGWNLQGFFGNFLGQRSGNTHS